MNSLIEALLYIKGSEGLNSKDFSSVVKEFTVPQARKQLNKFLKEWNDKEHGLKVLNFNDTFKFATIKKHEETISLLVTQAKIKKLSIAAVETIGIISYKQPITKTQINEIRGISSESVVNTLLVKGLIVESGFLKKPGNPILYKVSEKFYDYFNLSSLEELPKLSEFSENIEEEDFELFASQRED